MNRAVISEELFGFLSAPSRHNHRDWFEQHRDRYVRHVQQPAVELIAQLKRPLARSAPMLDVVAKPHRGSLMRIHRDTRFSNNKQPYKTNVGISLRHQAGKDIHAPGIDIHFDPEECFLGAGCWGPDRHALADIRGAIDADPKAWRRARDHQSLRPHFELDGDRLKTAPRDYPRDHPLIEDLRRKDFIAVTPLSRDQVLGAELVPLLTERIRQA